MFTLDRKVFQVLNALNLEKHHVPGTHGMVLLHEPIICNCWFWLDKQKLWISCDFKFWSESKWKVNFNFLNWENKCSLSLRKGDYKHCI